jgi:hypothetical protein
MSGVGFPLKRPVGRALIVGSASTRAQPLAAMQALGFACAEVDDPYAATAELCRRPLVYRALILSLASLYKEELTVVATVKRRLPHVEIWLTHIEGRQAALVEAISNGAAGLLGEDGSLHPLRGQQPAEVHASPDPEPSPQPSPRPSPQPAGAASDDYDSDMSTGEPVLSADELRALLQEQPSMPPDIES